MTDAYTETVTLTFMQGHTVCNALVAYALSPSSTDERIRECVDALTAVGFGETGEALARLQADTHSVRA